MTKKFTWQQKSEQDKMGHNMTNYDWGADSDKGVGSSYSPISLLKFWRPRGHAYREIEAPITLEAALMVAAVRKPLFKSLMKTDGNGLVTF